MRVPIPLVIYLQEVGGCVGRYLLIQLSEALQDLCVKTRMRLWGGGEVRTGRSRSRALSGFPAEKRRAAGCNKRSFMST